MWIIEDFFALFVHIIIFLCKYLKREEKLQILRKIRELKSAYIVVCILLPIKKFNSFIFYNVNIKKIRNICYVYLWKKLNNILDFIFKKKIYCTIIFRDEGIIKCFFKE